MPKFKAVILKQQENADGRFPLQIRVTNNRQLGYIKTGWYVREVDLDDKGIVQDIKLRNLVDQKILELEAETLTRFGIGTTIGGNEIAQYFKRERVDNVDVIAYYRNTIKAMKKAGRDSSAGIFSAALNHLISFVQTKEFSVHKVTKKFLEKFQTYLEEGGTGKRGVSATLSSLRTIFNDIISEYNDEDNNIIVVKHYPFKSFKIKDPVCTKIRHVSPEIMKQIITCDTLTRSRDILAQDMIALSFFLAGINLADLYHMKKNEYIRGRLEYCRRKTKKKSDDNAFMSIAVPKEALPIFEKYKDTEGDRLFNFYQRYGKETEFVRGVNKGCKHISEILDLPKLTSYTARHSFARICKKNLHLSLEEIGACLNHATKLKITEGYAKKDFERIDEIVRMVIDFVLYRKVEKAKTKIKKHTPKKSCCDAISR